MDIMDPIMIFEVSVDPADITEMECAYGAISILPFKAKVNSELFTGETLPGVVDVQQENPAGIRNMSARYVFFGKDRDGNECHLFVENEGWFRGSEKHEWTAGWEKMFVLYTHQNPARRKKLRRFLLSLGDITIGVSQIIWKKWSLSFIFWFC